MISIFVLLFIKFKGCIYKFRFPEIIDENKKKGYLQKYERF